MIMEGPIVQAHNVKEVQKTYKPFRKQKAPSTFSHAMLKSGTCIFIKAMFTSFIDNKKNLLLSRKMYLTVK